MFEHNQDAGARIQQNENSSWNHNLKSADANEQGFHRELHQAMTDPKLWDSVRTGMQPAESQEMNRFPSSDSLLGDIRDSSPTRQEQPQPTDQAAPDNFMETALKAPGLLMQSWDQVSGLGEAQQMVSSVLRIRRL